MGAHMNLPTEIRQKIIARLAELDLNQRWLADIVGVAQPHLSERLQGMTPFKDGELERIANALELHDVLGSYIEPQSAAEREAMERKLVRDTMLELLDVLTIEHRRELCLVASIVVEGKLSPRQRRMSSLLRALSRLRMSPEHV